MCQARTWQPQCVCWCYQVPAHCLRWFASPCLRARSNQACLASSLGVLVVILSTACTVLCSSSQMACNETLTVKKVHVDLLIISVDQHTTTDSSFPIVLQIPRWVDGFLRWSNTLSACNFESKPALASFPPTAVRAVDAARRTRQTGCIIQLSSSAC